jgi:NAD(P)-dependent dehydrogenase (short-subunit alcohol dehydrogenase family)
MTRCVPRGATAQGHKALAIAIACDAQVEAMVAQTVAALGRLDAAYNNSLNTAYLPYPLMGCMSSVNCRLVIGNAPWRLGQIAC